MFTQRISMDCTKEQYEKYLKDELLEMGYNEKDMYWGRNINIFTNAFRGIMGYMIDINEDSQEKSVAPISALSMLHYFLP